MAGENTSVGAFIQLTTSVSVEEEAGDFTCIPAFVLSSVTSFSCLIWYGLRFETKLDKYPSQSLAGLRS